jgi:hypothetical protein
MSEPGNGYNEYDDLGDDLECADDGDDEATDQEVAPAAGAAGAGR